ncbi:hydantoinase/oxoprolinase family protein [Brevibacterium luteolum]|uniref:hydantoinase/oxoprolinase family protein n=1 Tax=Brevibacterium luteolum TaxID=199591 RepID=UPI00215562CD|nr:hydantoinase/oxoprolinase family protein [Brevibacterium luteolum]
MTEYRLGIDVGGTNTDAVILDNATLEVISAVKSPTTKQTSDGVLISIDQVLQAAQIDPASIRFAMIGTTHATNAILERRDLGRVGVVRVAAPATTAVPPLEGWPDDLKSAIGAHSAIVGGGFEVDGRAIADIDEDEIRAACRRMRGSVDAVAIVGVFSPVDVSQEQRAGEIVVEELGVPVSLSAEIGSIGLLERESATILNASLMQTLCSMADGLRRALSERGISAHMFFGQNDGTLMEVDYALRYPVLTIGGGPTNSIRGAAHLSGLRDGIVVDVGGTTTDIGMLIDGFPRQSSEPFTLGGVRTNFRMPDILSIALGGGTVVREASDGIRLGPDSVGYRLPQESLSFGGDTLTATDVALAAGLATIDSAVDVALSADLVTSSRRAIREVLEDAIDQMKLSAAAVPVILVGGGGIIVGDELHGVSEIVKPLNLGAANAVGVALGDIAGEVEKIVAGGSSRESMRAVASAEAVERAVEAGADPETVVTTSIEELPVSYMEGESVRIVARAVGRLRA